MASCKIGLSNLSRQVNCFKTYMQAKLSMGEKDLTTFLMYMYMHLSMVRFTN